MSVINNKGQVVYGPAPEADCLRVAKELAAEVESNNAKLSGEWDDRWDFSAYTVAPATN